MRYRDIKAHKGALPLFPTPCTVPIQHHVLYIYKLNPVLYQYKLNPVLYLKNLNPVLYLII